MHDEGSAYLFVEEEVCCCWLRRHSVPANQVKRGKHNLI